MKPWAMKESAIIDPHGNLLRFGCAPQDLPPEPDQPQGASRMFVAANRFRVIPAHAEEFERTWLSRESRLQELDGFLNFHLLKGPQSEDHILYSSFTLWASREAFEAWTRSDQFRRAHASAGSTKPVTLGHPQFEGFDVLQTIGPAAPKPA
jgi:heme-degrading monooxygenase HmoA